jgi:hypothetical protein
VPVSFLTLFLAAAAGAAEPETPKLAALPLFADIDWYQKASGTEQTFEGTLEINPGTGQIGKPTRFNSYRLTWTTPDGTRNIREIYAPGKAQFLALYRGQRVRIIGKPAETKADGKVYAEIWPARLEPAGLVSPDAQKGILARCSWQPTGAKKRGETQWVITNGTDLAKHFGYFGADVDKRAGEDIARALKVPSIDWKKQMVICIAAGLHANGERIRVTSVTLRDKMLIVSYRLEHPADGAAGLCYPAESVLVDRFDGEVKYEAEAGK